MKILAADAIRRWDLYTIENEPVESIDLMERAADKCTDWLLDHFGSMQQWCVISGPGNNGGDGLAIARLLLEAGKDVTVVMPNRDRLSDDCIANLDRWRSSGGDVTDPGYLSDLPNETIIVDCLFGTGLNRAPEGIWARAIESVSNYSGLVIAVDLPSGLIADRPTAHPVVQADFTLTFQIPKLAFMVPENGHLVGEWVLLDIGLHPDFPELRTAHRLLTTREDATRLLAPKAKFDHKGKNGRAMLIVGSFGKLGAAILASRAALRSGLGLLTVHVPKRAADILPITVPEAMVEADRHDFNFSGLNEYPSTATIGIGCGLGVKSCTTVGVEELLSKTDRPLVVDADGLNILAARPRMLDMLPAGSILTPHLAEFERLFGASSTHFARLQLLRSKAVEHSLVIVLKGAHTAIGTPAGETHFNSTGNAGMATAGSGDVLTGIVTSLLAQGYSSVAAAKLAVFLHGLAGDLAADVKGLDGMIAGDIVDFIPNAIKDLRIQ